MFIAARFKWSSLAVRVQQPEPWFVNEPADTGQGNIQGLFGHHSTGYLAKLCKQSPAYRAALKRGERTEIPLEAIRKTFERATDSPPLDSVVRPKWARSATGKAVTVKAWNPTRLKP